MRLLVPLLAVLTIMGFAVPTARAAAPANDDFANAQVLTAGDPDPSLPSPVVGTLAEATAETGEPHHNGFPATRSVWYEITATETSRLQLWSCVNAGPPPFASIRRTIYIGESIDSLEIVVEADGCNVSFVGFEGETYRVAVDGGPSDQGSFTQHLWSHPRPANDDFADAEIIPSQTTALTVHGTTEGGTWEWDEPDFFGQIPAEVSVWYRWTAPASGVVKIQACNDDTVLAAYTGTSLESLVLRAESDDDCTVGSPYGAAVDLSVVAGQEYRIAVDNLDTSAWTTSIGEFSLDVGPVRPAPPPPPPPQVIDPPSAPQPVARTCGKGKKLKGGRCIKKKRAKRGK